MCTYIWFPIGGHPIRHGRINRECKRSIYGGLVFSTKITMNLCFCCKQKKSVYLLNVYQQIPDKEHTSWGFHFLFLFLCSLASLSLRRFIFFVSVLRSVKQACFNNYRAQADGIELHKPPQTEELWVDISLNSGIMRYVISKIFLIWLLSELKMTYKTHTQAATTT